jgi:uncharacterized damage-inducible protein DinB
VEKRAEKLSRTGRQVKKTRSIFAPRSAEKGQAVLDFSRERDIVPSHKSTGCHAVARLGETVANGLAAYYEYVAEQLHQWVDPLTNEQFWRQPYPYGNSIGHLVLHLTGNLSYYIGARIAETDYVRYRDREFNDPQPPHKDEALRAFDRTVATVVATIRKQSEEDWGKAYTAEREPEAKDRFQIFVRCAGHAYHHVGQVIYLSRELARA